MPPRLDSGVIQVGLVESFSMLTLPEATFTVIRTNKSPLLLRCQLFDKLVKSHGQCEHTQFNRLCQRASRPGSPTLTLGSSLMAQLHDAKALKPRSSSSNVVVTAPQALSALKKARVPQALRDELETLVQQQGQSHQPSSSTPTPTSPGFHAGHLHLSPELPDQPPLHDFPVISLGQRFGLKGFPAAHDHPVLQEQQAAFTSFFMSPFHLKRKGQAMSAKSMEGVWADVLYILGYLHRFCGVQFPNLYHLVNAEWVAMYIASRLQAGLAGGSMAHDLDALGKVVEFFLGQKGMDKGEVHDQLSAFAAWLLTLASQVRHNRPQVKKQPFHMQAAGKWATTCALVECFEAARVKVLEDVQHWQDGHPGQQLSFCQSLEVQDVLYANMMFGQLPPMRLECIRTMRRPDVSPACLEEHCQLGPECAGNRLELTTQGSIRLVFPHHKNRRTWGTDIVIESVPPQLEELFLLYLREAMPTLTRVLPKAQLHGLVFFTRTGIPHPNSMSLYFNSVMKRLGMPQQLHIAPQNLRHIFIEERLGVSSVPGPSDRGASLVMGNSVGAWRSWYELSRWDGRSAQRAVDDMQTWRAAILQQVPGQAVQAPEQVARAAAAACRLEPCHVAALEAAPEVSDDDDQLIVDIGC